MRILICFALATMLAAPALARERLEPEAQLSKMIEGRTAGKPTDCISLNRDTPSTTIDHTAVVYQQGGTLYVNRFGGSCPALDGFSVLVTRTTTDRLCRGDSVQIMTQPPAVLAGVCIFGDFTPYTKAK